MSKGTEKGQHRKDLGNAQYLDARCAQYFGLKVQKAGESHSDTRKGGRGFYLEDNGEPWTNFKKEKGGW